MHSFFRLTLSCVMYVVFLTQHSEGLKSPSFKILIVGSDACPAQKHATADCALLVTPHLLSQKEFVDVIAQTTKKRKVIECAANAGTSIGLEAGIRGEVQHVDHIGDVQAQLAFEAHTRRLPLFRDSEGSGV